MGACVHSTKVYKELRDLLLHIRENHSEQRVSSNHELLDGLPGILNCECCGQPFKSKGITKHLRQCREIQLTAAQTGVATTQPNTAVPITALEDMVAYYRHTMDFIHHQWYPLLQLIIARLLETLTASSSEEEQIRNASAFFMLPGLVVRYHHVHKRSRATVKILLNAILDHTGGPAARILAEGRNLREANPPDEGGTRKTPTPASTKSKIDRLVKYERYSAACAQVDVLGNLVADRKPTEPLSLEFYRNKVKELHPEANHMDVLPPNPPEGFASEALQFERDADIVEGLKELPLGSARGATGWTFRAMRMICLWQEKDEDPNQGRCIAAVRHFFNKCLRGEFPQAVVACLTVSRSVLIPKSDNGWRPLGIGECWYRLLGRVALKQLTPSLADTFLPVQLAVGTPGGVEIAGRLCQVMYDYDADYCTGSLDMKNAFNSLRRRFTYQGVCKYCPKLERLFRSVYGGPAVLRDSNGTVVGQSATGVRQGDPLAFLFYCAGIQDFLLELRQAFGELCGNFLFLLWAYADDIHFAGPTAACKEFLDKGLPQHMQDAGLIFQLKKCKLLGPNLPAGDEPCVCKSDGADFLGTPVGQERYVKDRCTKLIEDQLATLESMKLVSAQSAFLLVKHCINSRPQYLARVVEPNVSTRAMALIDNHVDACLAHIVKVQPDNDEEMRNIRAIRQLPESKGGFGIPSFLGPQRDLGTILSRKFLTDFCDYKLGPPNPEPQDDRVAVPTRPVTRDLPIQSLAPTFQPTKLQRHIETEKNTFFLCDDKQANRELLREGVKGMLDKVRTDFMDSIQKDILLEWFKTLSIPQ
jgi:hypothetical protein